MLLKLKVAEPEMFRNDFEQYLSNSTYLWTNEDGIIYDKSRDNIFDYINFEDLSEAMSFSIERLETVEKIVVDFCTDFKDFHHEGSLIIDLEKFCISVLLSGKSLEFATKGA